MHNRTYILQQIILTLNHFHAYLDGGSTEALSNYMKKYDKWLEDLDRDFFTTTLHHEELQEPIEGILASLGIPNSEWDKYHNKDDTMYSFLAKLSQAGYIQAYYFMEMIDDKKLVRNAMIGLSILYPTLIVTALTTTPFFPEILAFVTEFLASEASVPVLGMVQTTLTLGYNLYQIFADQKQSLSNQLRDAAFAVAKAAVSYLGQTLLLLDILPMTWALAGILLVTSIFDVAREIVCWVQEEIQYWRTPAASSDDPLVLERAKIRHEYAYQQHRNAAIIGLVSVILMAAATAVLTFVPSLVASLLAVAAIGLVYGVSYVLNCKNESILRERMQVALANAGEGFPAPRPMETELTNFAALGDEHDIAVSPTSSFVDAPRPTKNPAAAALPFFMPEDRGKIEPPVPEPTPRFPAAAPP